MQVEGILIGFLVCLAVIAVGAFLYILNRVERRLKLIAGLVVDMQESMIQMQDALLKTAEQTQTLRQLTAALLKSIGAMDQTTLAIRGLSGLLVTTPAQEELPQPVWTRGAPPNPPFDGFSRPEDSGFLEQTDEDMAEIEQQEQLRQQGIETDPLQIHQPAPEDINYGNS